jgi:hypothetical protein
VKYHFHNKRYVDFKIVADQMDEPNFGDWPIEGPHTTAWCLRHMCEHGGTPIAHHNRYVSEGKLAASDGGVAAHETACRILQVASCYDQLHVSQLV